MRNRNAFLLGAFASRLGDSFSFLAFILILINRSSSNALVSTFMVAHYLPGVLIGILGRGAFDRIPCQTGLIISYAASALLTFAACLFTRSTVALLVLATLLGICYGFYVPLQRAFVAEISPPELVKRANSQLQLADVLAKTGGFMLAGLVFRKLGPVVCFSIDALSFCSIAALIATIRPPYAAVKAKTERKLLDDAKRVPHFSYATSIFAVTWLGTGSLFALEAGYAKEYLGASETMVGWLFATATIGSLLAPKLALLIPKKTELKALSGACIGEALFVIGYGSTSNLALATACIVGYGALLTFRHVSLSSWIHATVPQTGHGRAFALQQGKANLFMMLGMGSSGLFAQIFGSRIVIVWAAAASLTLVLLMTVRRIYAEISPMARLPFLPPQRRQ
jgi:MFS family permease